MKIKFLLVPMAFIFALMAIATPISAAGKKTGYTVIISGEDVWGGASNMSGTWRGSGSVCATSMAVPKPPAPGQRGAFFIASFTITGGGPGTFVIPPGFNDTATGLPIPPGVHTFALDGLGTVRYSIDPTLPPGTVFPARATFNYTEGHSHQDVVIWMGVAPGVYIPMRLIHDAHVVINTVS